jgi:DNA-binding PadR family transcriptional regulator
MARSDQTQTAVLGALSIRPMTGYALREGIRSTLGNFWSESFGQIYPALAELERAAMVERRGAKDTRSSTFAITPAGSARLRELLSDPPQPSKPRNALMLRLFFGRQLGVDACRDLVLQARARAEVQLTELTSARAELEGQSLGEDSPFVLITVLAGEHGARATIAWADEALNELSALEEAALEGDGTPPRAHIPSTMEQS